MSQATTRRPGVWVGVGVLCLSGVILGQYLDAPGLLEARASPWRILLQVVAYLGLLGAWWQLRRTRRPLLVAGIWLLPMLFALPMHSRDVYSYAAQGWLLTQGISPYEVPSGQAGLWGLLVGQHWHETTSVYPSGSLMLFGLAAHWGSPSIAATVVILRLMNVVALALLACAVASIARRLGVNVQHALWLAVANPVILIQWIGGAHNDAIMVALLACALAVVLRPGWLPLAASGVLLGAAMGVKQSAALAGLGLVAVAWSVRHEKGGWGRLALTALAPGVTTVLTFAGLTAASGLGFGWAADSAGNPIAATSNAPLSWLASFLQLHELAGEHQINATLSSLAYGLIVVALLALWIWIGPRGSAPGRPWLFLILSLLSFGALGPAMQPWYLTWAIPFFPFVRSRWWMPLIAAGTLLAALQDALPPYVAMGLVAVLILAGYWWLRGARSRR